MRPHPVSKQIPAKTPLAALNNEWAGLGLSEHVAFAEAYGAVACWCIFELGEGDVEFEGAAVAVACVDFCFGGGSHCGGGVAIDVFDG